MSPRPAGIGQFINKSVCMRPTRIGQSINVCVFKLHVLNMSPPSPAGFGQSRNTSPARPARIGQSLNMSPPRPAGIGQSINLYADQF